jgi:glucose/arabinose dehydrogenase
VRRGLAAGAALLATLLPAPAALAQGLARSPGGPQAQTLATGLQAPWDLAFLPDGSALVTERPGRVRVLSGGRLPPPIASVSVRAVGEGGLLGVAVDPEFSRNRFVYLYRTTGAGNVVTRYRYSEGRLAGGRTIIRGIRAAAIHDGGRIRFGPDGRLYVSTGDAAVPSLAQSRRSRNGKFLRMGPRAYRGRGGRPEIFSRGHRNPQGFDWQPGSRRLVATEHGPVGNDEINVLRRGQNYGWPLVQGRQRRGGFVGPVALYDPAIAPSGATFVRRPGSSWTGDYLVATLRGQHLRRIRFSGLRPTAQEVLFNDQFGRLRVVVEGPDGALYVLTSNTGSSRGPQDDRLVRIVPPAG